MGAGFRLSIIEGRDQCSVFLYVGEVCVQDTGSRIREIGAQSIAEAGPGQIRYHPPLLPLPEKESPHVLQTFASVAVAHFYFIVSYRIGSEF